MKKMMLVIGMMVFGMSAMAADWQCGSATSDPFVKGRVALILDSNPYQVNDMVAANETVADFLSANLKSDVADKKDLCVKGSVLPGITSLLVYAVKLK